MKLFLNSFILFFFLCWPLLGKEIYKSYVVKVGGIKIGELNWQIKLEGDKYFNKLDLKNKGLF